MIWSRSPCATRPPAPELLVPPSGRRMRPGRPEMAAPERPTTVSRANAETGAPPAAPRAETLRQTPRPRRVGPTRRARRFARPNRRGFPIFDQPERANLPEVAESAFSLAEGPPAAAFPGRRAVPRRP